MQIATDAETERRAFTGNDFGIIDRVVYERRRKAIACRPKRSYAKVTLSDTQRQHQEAELTAG